MISRRTILAGVATALLLALVYFFATPLAWFIIRAGEEIIPSRISWDGKNAWARCESAIADKTSWPDTPQAKCAAMQLCANEAPLSEQQVELLTQAMREMPGCRAP